MCLCAQCGQQLPANHKRATRILESHGDCKWWLFWRRVRNLSPFSSEWGAVHSRPEAVGPGRAAGPPVLMRVTYHMAHMKPQGSLAGPASARGALTLQLLEPPFQLVVVVRHLPRVARRQRPRDAGRPLQFHYARRPPPTPIQLAAASARPGSAPCEAGWASGEPHPGRKATG